MKIHLNKGLKYSINFNSGRNFAFCRSILFILFINILFISSASANLRVLQDKKITIQHTNVPLSRIISDIEQKSGYSIIVRLNDVNVDEKYSINEDNKSLEQILTTLFKGKDIGFEIKGNTISVYKPGQNPASENSNTKKQIAGTVSDEKGEPIIGANVVEKGTTNGVITNIDGEFSLTVSENATLQISYIGYILQERATKGQSVLDILLKEDSQALDEVVVVGYGTQRKVNMTGAVAIATSKDLQGKAITNALEGLQGVIPNFNIEYGSGEPGQTPDLNIRGYESITGGGPLIIIDGTQSDSYFLSRLGPEDIESISVLKDAASSAIYGARAAFGVVLVTTKKGTRNLEKTNISFSTNVMMSRLTNMPKLVNVYEHAWTVNEALINAGSASRFKDEDVEKIRLYHMDPTKYPSEEITPEGDYYYWGTIDYVKETLKKSAMRSRSNLNISGGTKLVDYYISAGYTTDQGFIKFNNQDVDIYNVKAKINTNITKWWKVGLNMDYIKDKEDFPHLYNSSDSWWEFIYGQRMYFNIINPVNGYYTNNPVAYLKEGTSDTVEKTNAVITFETQITPLKGWNIYGKYTYWDYSTDKKDVQKLFTLSDNFGYRFPKDALWAGWSTISFVKEEATRSTRNTFDLYTDYTYRLGEHDMKGMIGFNQDEFRERSFYAERENLINEKVPSLNLTNGEDYVGQNEFHYATRSAFYRLNYSFKDRYLFETNGRYDGSSRFPKNSRFGFFPSVSAGWRISEESFMDWSRNYLDNLKFRASYGSLGNQDVLSYYAYIASMSANKVSYILGGQRPIGVSSPNLVTEDLTWETVNTLNLGLDFTMFNNRLNGSFDIYERRTLDMLTAGDAMPGILGASAPERNSADLSTKGWELALSWNDRINDFTYGIGLTLSDSRTKMTKYDNPTGSLSTHYVGKEMGEIWGYETVGFIDTEEKREHINSQNVQQFFYNGAWKLGDIEYRDLNGDGKIDRGDYTIHNPGDMKKIGNNLPRYIYGINLNFGWKGFAVSALFQGVGKRDFVPSNYLFWPYYSSWKNIQRHQMDTWRPENPNAYYPQLETGASRNYQTQTKYLQDASYIRLKNLSISYSLPKQIIKKIALEDVRVTLSGRNLWEHTNLIKPYDPETQKESGFISPFKREYALGLAVNF